MKVFLNFLDCPIVHKLCVCVQLWEIIHVPCMRSSISRTQCCTLCYSIMSHATLILYYHAPMLTLHNSIISCALWFATHVIIRSLECTSRDWERQVELVTISIIIVSVPICNFSEGSPFPFFFLCVMSLQWRTWGMSNVQGTHCGSLVATLKRTNLVYSRTTSNRCALLHWPSVYMWSLKGREALDKEKEKEHHMKMIRWPSSYRIQD